MIMPTIPFSFRMMKLKHLVLLVLHTEIVAVDNANLIHLLFSFSTSHQPPRYYMYESPGRDFGARGQ